MRPYTRFLTPPPVSFYLAQCADLPDIWITGMLMKRVRYFTDGAVIGSEAFVNEAFAAARGRFTERRKDGARRMRGSGKAALARSGV